MKTVLACAWLCLAGAALGADDAALRALDACRARLDARTDIGFERIDQRCPGLLAEMQRAPWSGLLPPGLAQRRDDISAESLRELAELVRATQAAAPAGRAPDIAGVAPVLDALGAQGQEGATRWERFRRWLQEKLERRRAAEGEDEESWIDELGRKLRTSEGLAEIITRIGYGLMGLLVLLVIWSELRAAGLLGGTRRDAGPGDPRSAWRRRLQLSDVAAAPLAERPGLLLRLLGDSLSRARRLPAPDGLTATAIAGQARLDDEADRGDLRSLADAADAVRYGTQTPPPERIESTTQRAQALLARLLKRRGSR